VARTALPKDVEKTVLTKSRRRCAICFGLDRDTRLKPGQIAHLDKSNSNNIETNLAFLCLTHHDEYDSMSSQRKNFTIAEVKEYRDELYATVGRALTQQVHFGEVTIPRSDPYAGTYIRIDSGPNSAELKLLPLPDSYEDDVRYYISGLAIWGAFRPAGPNLGTIDGVATMGTGRELVYARTRLGGDLVKTTLMFLGDGTLLVAEENWVGAYGMNVNFEGAYQRAS
jgi:hypothetical protein